MRRGILIAVLLALAALPGRAEEPEPKRRVVYVPHDQMDVLVGKHGKGVLLEVEEYQALRRAAGKGVVDRTEPASGAVVLTGRITAEADRERATLTAHYTVRVLAEGIQRVRFPVSHAAVGSATVDGRPALLAHDGKGGYLLLQGKGDHDVILLLESKVERNEEIRFFRFPAAPAGGLTLEVTLPPEMEPLPGLFGVARTERGEDATRVVAHLPQSAGVFAFPFRPRRDEGPRSTLLHARALTLHRVGPRLLRTSSRVLVSVYRKPVREIVLEVPSDLVVTGVTAPDLAGFDARSVGGRQSVRLAFGNDVSGAVPILVSMEKGLPGPGDLVLPAVRVPAAADVRGLVGIAFEEGVTGRVIEAKGAARVAIPAPPRQQGQQGAASNRAAPQAPQPDPIDLTGASAAYRYWAKDHGLTVRTSTPEGRRTCRVSVALRLLETYRELLVDLEYVAKDERIYRLAPKLPPEFELLAVMVHAPSPHRHDRLPDGTLAVDFPSGVPAEKPVRITARLRASDEAWRSEQWKDTTLPLPVPTAVTADEVKGQLAVFADDGLEVVEAELAGLRPEPVERMGLPAARLGYLFSGADARGSITVRRRLPKVSVRQVGFVAPGEKTAVYHGYLRYTVQRAGLRTFRFTVAGGHGDKLRVTPPGGVEPVRRRMEDGADLWTVTLPRRVRGEVAIGLHLEEEMPFVDARRTFAFPEVKVLDVEDETGYLAVETGDNMAVEVSAEGLREIDIEEMVFLGHVPARALLAAFQFSAHPFGLSLSTVKHEDMSVLTAFVRSAKILSAVAEDGTIRSRARYELLNTDRQFLRVRLSPSSRLWGAFVAGKPVKPSDGDGVALVPLGTTSGNQAVEVVLYYETTGRKLGRSGDLGIEVPTLEGVTGAEAEWEIWLPDDYRVTAASGVFGTSPTPPGKPFAFRLFRDVMRVLTASPGGGARAAGSDASVQLGAPSAVADSYEAAAKEVERTQQREKSVLQDPRSREAPPAPTTPAEPAPEEDAMTDAPFDGPSTNAAIGIGGGAGRGGTFRGPTGGGGPPGQRDPADPQPPPAPMLGRKGGLSIDVPLVPGGSHQALRALGVHGGATLSFAKESSRTSGGYVLSVFVMLATLFATGAMRIAGAPARKIPPFLFVAVLFAFATFAPWWFGARDLGTWDAVARGAFWGALLLVAVGLVRRIGGRLSAVSTPAAAILALVLLAGAARAEEPETVYVPYDPAMVGSTALEEPGRVFIPFERFRQLWNAAHPDRKLDRAEQVPVPWLLTAAGYAGTVEEETVRIDARYDLVVLDEGFVEVPLALAPSVVEQALVDGEPVRVLSRKGAHVLVLEGKGARRIELTLRLALERAGDRRRVAMSLPPIPRAVLRFALPFPDAEVKLAGPALPRVDGQTLTALLGAEGKLDLTFGTKTEAPEIAARVEAESREAVSVTEGRTVALLSTEWRVVTGSLDRLEYRLDTGWELIDVTGPDLKSYAVEGGRLVVYLGREVKDSTSVRIVTEKVDESRERAVAIPRTAPLGVVQERGVLGLFVSPYLRTTVSGLRNLDRIAAKAADFAGLAGSGARLHSGYRFVLRPIEMTIGTEAVRSEIRLSVPVQHLVRRERLLTKAAFTFDVRGDGTFEFPVRVPADMEIESVEGKGLVRWWRDGETLTFSTASPVRGRFQVFVLLRRALDPDAERVDLPEIHGIGVTRETGWVLVAHAPGLSLSLLEDEGLVTENVGAFSGWEKLEPDQVSRYGWREDGTAYKLAVARSFPAARVTPVATTRLQVEDDRVVVNVHYACAIENAGQDTFRVFFPEGEGEDPIVVADRQRSLTFTDAEVDGTKGRMMTLVLQQPALGYYGFRIAYEKRITLSGDETRRGGVTIAGTRPEGENPASYVFVTNQSAGEVILGRPTVLDVADATTFPFIPQGIDPRLILKGYRGRSADWALPVEIAIHSFAEFPDALITSANQLTAVGLDGWTRNRTTYHVLNRTRQFLEISLPEGGSLEAVRVSGRAVKPGRRVVGAEELILVPISRMQAGDESADVVLTWSRQIPGPRDLSKIRDLEILEPKVRGFEVEQTFFTLALPEGHRYTFDGNMRPIIEAAQEAFELEKDVEEYERLVRVQSEGNWTQQAKASESIARKRQAIGLKAEKLANLRGFASSLKQDLDAGAYTREEQAELARQAKEIVSNLARNDATVIANRNFLLAQTKAIAEDSKLEKAQLDELVAETLDIAIAQQAQLYRYKGKKGLVDQEWFSNSASAVRRETDFPGPRTNAAIGQGFLADREDREQVAAAWRRAFAQVETAATPQRDGVQMPGQEGEPSNRPAPVLKPAGAEVAEKSPLFAGRTTHGDRRRAGEDDLGLAFNESLNADKNRLVTARLPADTRAGLLSLPVTVPESGRVYRFEKRNGGAKLEVSVGDPGTGQGLAGFGFFCLAIAVVGAVHFFRPHRRVPFFGPFVLFLSMFLVALNARYFPLLAVAGVLASLIWFTVELVARLRRRASAA